MECMRPTVRQTTGATASPAARLALASQELHEDMVVARFEHKDNSAAFTGRIYLMIDQDTADERQHVQPTRHLLACWPYAPLRLRCTMSSCKRCPQFMSSSLACAASLRTWTSPHAISHTIDRTACVWGIPLIVCLLVVAGVSAAFLVRRHNKAKAARSGERGDVEMEGGGTNARASTAALQQADRTVGVPQWALSGDDEFAVETVNSADIKVARRWQGVRTVQVAFQPTRHKPQEARLVNLLGPEDGGEDALQVRCEVYVICATIADRATLTMSRQVKQMRRGRLLGKGAFGKVFLTIDQKGEMFAMKEHNIENSSRLDGARTPPRRALLRLRLTACWQEVKALVTEVQTMLPLKHPHIVGSVS